MAMVANTRSLREKVFSFIGELCQGMGRTESRDALHVYAVGLLVDGARKSIQPMAGRLAREPAEVEAIRQRLQEAVAFSPWDDETFRGRLALKIERGLPGLEAFICDDTGFPKKGTHSPGVKRQYSGTLGRTDNCQIAVGLHMAGEMTGACIGMRLYLPEEWAEDLERRRKGGIPDEATYQTKWEIALSLLDAAARWGLTKRPVLADSAYGRVTEFREALTEREWRYAVEITSDMVVWRAGEEPKPVEVTDQRGRRTTKWERRRGKKPVSVMDLAKVLGRDACKTITWREGTKGEMRSRFGCARVRHAHHHAHGRAPGPEEWLIWEWPEDKEEPVKFWLSNLPATTPLKALVRLIRMRWRVERDYQDLKEEVGLDHYEGRTWRGFHHHATMCMAAHAFLALQQGLFPPQRKEETRRARAADALPNSPGHAARIARDHRSLSLLPPPGRAAQAAAPSAAHAAPPAASKGAVGK